MKRSIPCRGCGKPNHYRLADEYCPSCLKQIETLYTQPKETK